MSSQDSRVSSGSTAQGSLPQDAAPACFAYVGCFTTSARNARGKGINVYRVDQSGRWDHVQLVPNLINPSFLALDRTGRFIYAAHGDCREISCFRIDPARGYLTRIGHQDTKGENPVHLMVDPTNRFAVVTNGGTSTIAVMPLRDDGSLGGAVDLVPIEGQVGPHRVMQYRPRPHQAQFDPAGRFIAVPDLGLDRIFFFRLTVQGKLIACNPVSIETRAGAGPRYIVFHPRLPTAYAVNHIDSTVTSYKYDPDRGTLSAFQIVLSCPPGFTGNSDASMVDVSVDGRFLFATSRGPDTLAVFSIDPETGWLTVLDFLPVGGKKPRFLASDPSGRFLFAVNETTDTITTFAIESGKVAPIGTIQTESPACIVFRSAG